MAGSNGTKRIHYTAKLGVALAVPALVLAWYGSLHAEKHLADSPLRQARGPGGLPAEPGNWYERLWDRVEVGLTGGHADPKMAELTERSSAARRAVEVVAFGLPLVLGLGGVLLGGLAMKRIEQARDRYVGNFQAVFAIMAGGFASVIAACMILSIYVWPHLPSPYN